MGLMRHYILAGLCLMILYTIVGLIIMTLLFNIHSRADSVIELKTADITYKHYTSDGMDPILYPAAHKDALNFNLDMDVFEVFYVKAAVLSESDASQFRSVGLNYHLGVNLDRHIAVEYEHLSMHTLDRTSYLPGFPRYDSINLVVHLLPVK